MWAASKHLVQMKHYFRPRARKLKAAYLETKHLGGLNVTKQRFRCEPGSMGELGEYCDYETGSKSNRAEFQQMFADASKRKFGVLES